MTTWFMIFFRLSRAVIIITITVCVNTWGDIGHKFHIIINISEGIIYNSYKCVGNQIMQRHMVVIGNRFVYYPHKSVRFFWIKNCGEKLLAVKTEHQNMSRSLSASHVIGIPSYRISFSIETWIPVIFKSPIITTWKTWATHNPTMSICIKEFQTSRL